MNNVLETIDKMIVTAILNGFSKAEHDFIEISEKHNENSGSCVNAVLITNNKIYVANLGDCRALLIKKLNDGWKTIQLSRDHKADIEKDRISESGGHIRNGRVNGILAISRAIGDRDFKRSSSSNFDKSKSKKENDQLSQDNKRVIQSHDKVKIKSLTRSASESNVRSLINRNTIKTSSPPISRLISRNSKRNIVTKQQIIEDEDENEKDKIVINCFDVQDKSKNIKKLHPPIDPTLNNNTLVSAIPEITIIPRNEEQLLLILGTDGLYDFFPNKKIGSLVKKLSKTLGLSDKTLEIICTLLCEEACDRGSEDDITTIVIQLRNLDSKKGSKSP